MTSESLSKKIDTLAEQKAYEHVRKMKYAVLEAAKQTICGVKAGDGTYFRETFVLVLKGLVEMYESNGRCEPPIPKSEEIANYYRAKILNELLEKMPLVKELAMMQDQTQGE